MGWMRGAAAALAVMACGQKQKDIDAASAVAAVVAGSPADAAPRAPPEKPLGPVFRKLALTQVAVYHLPRPRRAVRPEFEALVRAEKGLRVVTEPDLEPRPSVALGNPPIADYAPPSGAALASFGHGLSDAETAALSGCQVATTLTFVAPVAEAVAQLRRSHRMVSALAKRTGGLVWSEDTRLIFGPAAWQMRGERMASDPFDAGAAFTVHSYREHEGEGVRSVTVGLGQLGLPDLVVEEVVVRGGVPVPALIELVAQTLFEGGTPGPDGTLGLDVAAIRSPIARELVNAAVEKGGAGKGTVRLRAATRKEGDADNRLWQIDFPGDGSMPKRMAAMSAQIFGRKDEILGAVAYDAELMAASARARKALAGLEAGFGKGKRSEDHLLVKAPFKTTEGGLEYMWVEVRTWSGGILRGVLTDEPAGVPGLHAGATVEIQQANVYDYIVEHVDGSREGGETNEIIRRQGGPSRP